MKLFFSCHPTNWNSKDSHSIWLGKLFYKNF